MLTAMQEFLLGVARKLGIYCISTKNTATKRALKPVHDSTSIWAKTIKPQKKNAETTVIKSKSKLQAQHDDLFLKKLIMSDEVHFDLCHFANKQTLPDMEYHKPSRDTWTTVTSTPSYSLVWCLSRGCTWSVIF